MKLTFSKTVSKEGSFLLCYFLHHMAESQELPTGLADNILNALDMAGYDATTGEVKHPMVIHDWAEHVDHKLFPVTDGKFYFVTGNEK